MGDLSATTEPPRQKILSLQERFDALDDERRRSWAPEALAVNVNQRATLVREHRLDGYPEEGDAFPGSTLQTLAGDALVLPRDTAQKPVVLVFFRFAGCPACNIALPYYRDHLYPELARQGIDLIAVSPQPAELLSAIQVAHALPFTVATDPGLKLSRALGITYHFDEPSKSASIAKGGNPEALNGTSEWELPKPAVYVIDTAGKIAFRDVSPDWMSRTEADAILDRVHDLTR